MIATVTLNPSLDEWIELSAWRLGALHRAESFQRYPGGKGINVSRVIHELGGRTMAFALAGGADGLILRRLLEEMHIPHHFTPVAGTTRNNYKIRTRQPRALTEVNTPGPAVSPSALQRLYRQLLRGRRPDGVVLSGSLPPGAAPTVYARWIRDLTRRGIPAALDSSGPALRHGLAAKPWLVKPNREEAEELLGRRLSSENQMARAIRQLLRRGPKAAIISLGRDGALLGSAEGIWRAKPPAVTVNSAVGAGDSLVAGVVYGWTKGQPLVEAFRLGIACGAATAMTPGTELCHRDDVRRLLPKVGLRRVG